MKNVFLLFLSLVGASAEPSSGGAQVAADAGVSTNPGVAASPGAAMPELVGDALAPSTTSYRQALEMAGRKIEGKLVRKISQDQMNGRPVWKVVDSLTTQMGTAQDELWLDAKTLLPLKRAAKQGPATVQLAVGENQITGARKMQGQQMPIQAKVDGPVLFDGASLEVALGGLPLKPDYKTKLRCFNAMTGAIQSWTAQVAAQETVSVKGNQFETYKVSLSSGDDANSATLWIETSAPHRVIKSEAKLSTPGGAGKVTRMIEPAP